MSFSNEAIIDMLLSTNTRDNDKALDYLHVSLFNKVRKFIVNNSGSKSDSEDVFQDGLFSIYRMAKQGKLNSNIRVEPYLFSTCKYLWWKKLKRSDNIESLKEEQYDIQESELPLRKMISEEQRTLMKHILQALGSDCYRILILFYYNRMRMRQIVEAMNISNEQIAKNKKSNCMKKLRTLVFNSENYLGLR